MTKTFTDEDLTAYLDGALGKEARAELARAVAGDPALKARLEALAIQEGEIRDAFDALLSTAPDMPAPDMPVMAARPAGRGWPGFSGMAAAAAAVLVLGIALGAFVMPRGQGGPDWKMAVANYQALYVAETLRGAPGGDAEARLAALSATLGRELAGAEKAEGLAYRRAQMLGFEGAPLVQIAYFGPGEVPFAFCITRVEGAAYAPRAEMLAGQAAAHWVEGGFGFLVIGGADLGTAARLAEDLRARI